MGMRMEVAFHSRLYKNKTRKYVNYSIVYNFHAQSNIKNDFLKALSVLQKLQAQKADQKLTN